MKRRLRKTVKWTLTVLAVLTLVAWVGSCWVLVFTLWQRGAMGGMAYLNGGRILIEIRQSRFPTLDGSQDFFSCVVSAYDPHVRWGFRYHNYAGWPYGFVFIPLWLPCLLLAAPAAWLWWRGDRRRFPETACQFCGYDISGAPHERCPECGKEI